MCVPLPDFLTACDAVKCHTLKLFSPPQTHIIFIFISNNFKLSEQSILQGLDIHYLRLIGNTYRQTLKSHRDLWSGSSVR